MHSVHRRTERRHQANNQKLQHRNSIHCTENPPTVTNQSKDHFPDALKAYVVYRITCSCGKVHIRETQRAFGMRIREHQDACRLYRPEKSAVIEHAWSAGHRVDAQLYRTASHEKLGVGWGTRLLENLVNKFLPPLLSKPSHSLTSIPP